MKRRFTLTALVLLAALCVLLWRVITLRRAASAPGSAVAAGAQAPAGKETANDVSASPDPASPALSDDTFALLEAQQAERDPRVVRFEEMVESFERDAAAFRARYPGYADLLDLVRNDWGPVIAKRRRIKPALEEELQGPRGGEFQAELDQVYKEDVVRPIMIGILLNQVPRAGMGLYDAVSSGVVTLEKKKMDELGAALAIMCILKPQEYSARLSHLVSDEMRREIMREAEERNITQYLDHPVTDVNAVFADSDLAHRKFIVEFAEGCEEGTKFFAGYAEKLPPDLEERRSAIEETRKSLVAEALLGGRYACEYVEPYMKSLLEPVKPSEGAEELSASAAAEMRFTAAELVRSLRPRLKDAPR